MNFFKNAFVQAKPFLIGALIGASVLTIAWAITP